MTVTVSSACGDIIGLQREGYAEFRGIPYAEQPIGVARFKAPEPLIPFDEPYKAEKFSDSAPQEMIPFMGIKETSEDCLYLNVWSPACDNKKRPVMVWLHGGAYVTGSGSQVMYRGAELAMNGDVVIVTINYRLGALGFLYLNELLPESAGVSANNGLLDQIEALKWIQANIASFGGNPNDITLFGESAGAMSIATLMACPSAKGLFHKAILQSAAADQVLTRSEATDIARRFLEVAEIDPENPEKLWQLSPQQIVKAQRHCQRLSFNRGAYGQPVPQSGLTLLPVVDGTILPQSPIASLKQGESKDIPIMLGCTREEWNLFTKMPGADAILMLENLGNMSKHDLIAACEKSLPGMGEGAANLYESVAKQTTPNPSCSDIYSAFESDRIFRIPTLRIAEWQSKHSDLVFMFQFNWDKGMFGACHASDIPFVFGGTDTPGGQFFTGGGDAADKLKNIVQNCWIAFARSSDPSTDRIGKWEPFKVNNRKVMCFDETTELKNDPLKPVVSLWEGVL